MRFLLGLMLGAALVVVAAQAVTGAGDWRGRLAAAVQRIEDLATRSEPSAKREPSAKVEPSAKREPSAGHGRAAVAEATFGAGRSGPPGAAPRPPARTDAPSPSGRSARETPALAGERPEPAQQPLPPAPDPAPVDTAAATAVAGPAAALGVGAEGAPPATSTARSGALPPAPAAAATGDPEPGFQTVWVPFHSELSARGFATRLTESLNHAFQVERRGPGRYQVVFGYRDESQRRDLLARAADVTGLPL